MTTAAPLARANVSCFLFARLRDHNSLCNRRSRISLLIRITGSGYALPTTGILYTERLDSGDAKSVRPRGPRGIARHGRMRVQEIDARVSVYLPCDGSWMFALGGCFETGIRSSDALDVRIERGFINGTAAGYVERNTSSVRFALPSLTS